MNDKDLGWTPEDESEALVEGWKFQDGEVVADGRRVFRDDDQAKLFVKLNAGHGSPLHSKANSIAGGDNVN